MSSTQQSESDVKFVVMPRQSMGECSTTPSIPCCQSRDEGACKKPSLNAYLSNEQQCDRSGCHASNVQGGAPMKSKSLKNC